MASMVASRQLLQASFRRNYWFRQINAPSFVRIAYQRQVYIRTFGCRSYPRLLNRICLSEHKRFATVADEKEICWKCGESVSPDHLFCAQCGLIQPPNTERNYFETLGTVETFDLDEQALTTRFRTLQWKLHPDKFSQKSQTERELSEQQSSLVNKAYSVLLKPLSRGFYLLDLHGQSVEEGEIQMEPAFLMEIMEINEELAAAKTLAEARRVGAENQRVLSELIGQVSQAFKAEDVALAKTYLMKLKYYANIDDKVKELERAEMYKA